MRAIPYIMGALLLIVGLTIAFSAKKHVETVSTAIELAKDKEKLQQDVQIIRHTVRGYDSIVASKDSTIKTQKKSIFGLLREVATKLMVTSSVVTIHDTVFITEKKSFWGKTKTSVVKSETSIDSSSSTVTEEPILMGSVTAPEDTIKR